MEFIVQLINYLKPNLFKFNLNCNCSKTIYIVEFLFIYIYNYLNKWIRVLEHNKLGFKIYT